MRPHGGVIAIDGPSASGKSSTARAVAERLGFAHLDSGALYRGVTLVALREAARRSAAADGDPLAVGAEAVLRAAEERGLVLHPDGSGFAAYLEGEPCDEAIRTAEVTRHVSAVSAVPEVRARRRVLQRHGVPDEAAIAWETALLTARDAADAGRAVAPLRQAPDARALESSGLTFNEQVERIVGWAREALGKPA